MLLQVLSHPDFLSLVLDLFIFRFLDAFNSFLGIYIFLSYVYTLFAWSTYFHILMITSSVIYINDYLKL